MVKINKNPFITFLFNEETKSIENMYVGVLNPNHKEVKSTINRLKNKVVERHLGVHTTEIETFSKANEVNDKCNELILRIKYLQLQTETEESHLTDICDNIEPLLRDVKEKFEALNDTDKETFTSKTLDIFYSLEKKIKSYEYITEQRKKQILEQYFADMEKQAEKKQAEKKPDEKKQPEKKKPTKVDLKSAQPKKKDTKPEIRKEAKKNPKPAPKAKPKKVPITEPKTEKKTESQNHSAGRT